MMTTTVLVICDHSDDEDFCEAEFEVLRDGLKDVRKYLLAADVDPVYQLQLMDPTKADIGGALGPTPKQ